MLQVRGMVLNYLVAWRAYQLWSLLIGWGVILLDADSLILLMGYLKDAVQILGYGLCQLKMKATAMIVQYSIP